MGWVNPSPRNIFIRYFKRRFYDSIVFHDETLDRSDESNIKIPFFKNI